jgi:glycosyltransferase involved in cell wall biosynthesis
MNKKITILYLTTSSIMGGAEKQLYHLATGLSPERFSVLVCTLKDDGPLVRMLKERGIHTESVGMRSKLDVLKLITLWKMIKRYRPDVIQSFLFFDNIVGRILGKLAHVKVIISGQRNVEPYRSRIRNFLDKITLPLSDYVISNSEAGKRILIHREHVIEGNIAVIYNGIAVPNIQKSERKNNTKKIVGFVGHITEQKGVKTLLKAAQIVKKELPNVEFVLVGDGPEKKHLEKLAKTLGIEDTAHFIGHLEHPVEEMKKFDVLVIPSLWEGVPNVILEAMSCKVPVVASKVGGVPELVDDGRTGFLVPPKDEGALAATLKTVLQLSKQDREELGKRGYKRVQQLFSFEKMINTYQDTYENLLG